MTRLRCLVLVAGLSSCAHTQPTFEGTWLCDAGPSGVYVWHVDSHRITAEFQDESGELTYTLIRSHNPHWLDLISENEVHRSILEFVDADTFRVTGLDGNSARPSDFTTDVHTLTFKRMKQGVQQTPAGEVPEAAPEK